MRNASNSDIPEELQVEILSRLPPESLSRCKCVSKHWNDTLTIQAFLLSHSRSYDKHLKLAFVVCSTDYGSRNLVLSFDLNDDNTPKTTTVTVPAPLSRTIVIVGRHVFTRTGAMTSSEEIIRAHEVGINDFHKSKHTFLSNICNDLICVSYHLSTRVGLLNIKTLDFINLPEQSQVTMISMDAIKFRYALGFDPVRKVFKVLSIYYGSRKGTPKAVTLTLGSNYWKPIERDCLPCSMTKISPYSSETNTFHVDGVIYWVIVTNTLSASILTVVAFDLNREVFKDYELVVTPIEVVKTFGYYLTSLKGCPTLFTWKMKSDENHEIQLLSLFNHKNPNASWTRRSFISNSFPMMFSYSFGERSFLVEGGSILLRYVASIKGSVKSQEQDNTESTWYILYDLEKFAME